MLLAISLQKLELYFLCGALSATAARRFPDKLRQFFPGLIFGTVCASLHLRSPGEVFIYASLAALTYYSAISLAVWTAVKYGLPHMVSGIIAGSWGAFCLIFTMTIVGGSAFGLQSVGWPLVAGGLCGAVFITAMDDSEKNGFFGEWLLTVMAFSLWQSSVGVSIDFVTPEAGVGASFAASLAKFLANSKTQSPLALAALGLELRGMSTTRRAEPASSGAEAPRTQSSPPLKLSPPREFPGSKKKGVFLFALAMALCILAILATSAPIRQTFAEEGWFALPSIASCWEFFISLIAVGILAYSLADSLISFAGLIIGAEVLTLPLVLSSNYSSEGSWVGISLALFIALATVWPITRTIPRSATTTLFRFCFLAWSASVLVVFIGQKLGLRLARSLASTSSYNNLREARTLFGFGMGAVLFFVAATATAREGTPNVPDIPRPRRGDVGARQESIMSALSTPFVEFGRFALLALIGVFELLWKLGASVAILLARFARHAFLHAKKAFTEKRLWQTFVGVLAAFTLACWFSGWTPEITKLVVEYCSTSLRGGAGGSGWKELSSLAIFFLGGVLGIAIVSYLLRDWLDWGSPSSRVASVSAGIILAFFCTGLCLNFLGWLSPLEIEGFTQIGAFSCLMLILLGAIFLGHTIEWLRGGFLTREVTLPTEHPTPFPTASKRQPPAAVSRSTDEVEQPLSQAAAKNDPAIEPPVDLVSQLDEEIPTIPTALLSGLRHREIVLLMARLQQEAPRLAASFQAPALRERFLIEFGSRLGARLKRLVAIGEREERAITEQWIKVDLLPTLNALAHFYSEASEEKRHRGTAAEGLARDLRVWLYEDFNKSCRAENWFAIDPIEPYVTPFDPLVHLAVSGRAVEGPKGLIIAIRAIGRRHPRVGTVVYKAEVIVGR